LHAALKLTAYLACHSPSDAATLWPKSRRNCSLRPARHICPN